MNPRRSQDVEIEPQEAAGEQKCTEEAQNEPREARGGHTGAPGGPS